MSKGELLLEVMTDKVNLTVKSPASGILAQIVAREGEAVPYGNLIAVIAEKGKNLLADFMTAPQEGQDTQPQAAPAPSANTVPGEIRVSAVAARKLAQKKGLSAEDLAGIQVPDLWAKMSGWLWTRKRA